MPEQQAIFITVSVAPQVTTGLHALVQKTLSGAASQAKPKAGRRAGEKIVNRVEGDVRGTVFQIGKVDGDVEFRGR